MASIFIPQILTLNFIPPAQNSAPSCFSVDPITHYVILCTLLTVQQTQHEQNWTWQLDSPDPGFLEVFPILVEVPLFIKLFTWKLDPGSCSISISTFHYCYFLLIAPCVFIQALPPPRMNPISLSLPHLYHPSRDQASLPQESLSSRSDLVRSPYHRLYVAIYFYFAALSKCLIADSPNRMWDEGQCLS